MSNIELVSRQRFLQFFLLAYSIAIMILCNSALKEMQTQILVEKTLKNVPKVSLNMSPYVNILGFPLEVSYVLHLIQLGLGKY